MKTQNLVPQGTARAASIILAIALTIAAATTTSHANAQQVRRHKSKAAANNAQQVQRHTSKAAAPKEVSIYVVPTNATIEAENGTFTIGYHKTKVYPNKAQTFVLRADGYDPMAVSIYYEDNKTTYNISMNKSNAVDNDSDNDDDTDDDTDAIEEQHKDSDIDAIGEQANEYNRRGSAAMENGMYDRAIEHYLKIINMPGASGGIKQTSYFRIGECYYKKGNYDYAIKYFNLAIEILPDYDEAWYMKGLAQQRSYGLWNIYYSKGRESFEHAVDAAPHIATYWLELGKSYRENYDHNKHRPDYYYSYYLYDVEQYNAIVCFKKAVKLDPDMWEAWWNLGKAALDRLQRCCSVMASTSTVREPFKVYSSARENEPALFETAYDALTKVVKLAPKNFYNLDYDWQDMANFFLNYGYNEDLKKCVVKAYNNQSGQSNKERIKKLVLKEYKINIVF